MHLVDAQQARRVVDRLVGYTLSPLLVAQGPQRPVRGPRPVGGGAPRRGARARGHRVRRPRVLDPPGAAPDRRRRPFPADLVRIDGVRSTGGELCTRSGRGGPPGTHADALRRDAPGREQDRASASRSGRRRPPFTTSTLQQEASRKLGFSPQRTMSVAQRLYEGIEVDGESVGLTTYMRTDSTSMAGVAMGEAREVIGSASAPSTRCPRAGSTRPRPRVPRRPTRRSGRRASTATPIRSPAGCQSEELPPLPAHLAARPRLADDREAARDHLRGPDRRPLRTACLAPPGRCSTASPGSTPRVATTTPRRTRPRAGLPDLAEGQVTSVDGRHARPSTSRSRRPGSPRRPSSRRSRSTASAGRRRTPPPSRPSSTAATSWSRRSGCTRSWSRSSSPTCWSSTSAEFVDVEFTARMEQRLDEIARGEREWVPLMREFYGPFKELVDVKRKELKRADITTEPSDEVCSEGHPMVIRLGRNGRFLSCSLYPEHKESRPHPGRGAGGGGHGRRGRDLPRVRRGDPRPEARPVRRLRGLLPLPRLQATSARTARRRPSSCRSRSPAPPAPRVTWSRGAPAGRAACSGAARAIPKCTFTTSREPVGAVHDADAGVVARNADGTGICLRCGAAIPLPDVVGVGRAARRRPAGPGGHRAIGATWWRGASSAAPAQVDDAPAQGHDGRHAAAATIKLPAKRPAA